MLGQTTALFLAFASAVPLVVFCCRDRCTLKREERGMHNQHSNMDHQSNTQSKSTHWIDTVDLELIFMNSIAICVILLAIVAADVFMN